MFPLLNKHLYLGQDVDGYAVVSFNSNYTGGLMRSPLINPLPSYNENYADSLNTITNYNSGGSVNVYGGGTTTTVFTDWRLPTKTELDTIINLYDNTPASITPINQVIWTSTNGVSDPTNAKYCMESGVSGYLLIEYDKSALWAMMLVRSFTL